MKFALVLVFSLIAQSSFAAVIAQGDVKIETQIAYVKLEVLAKCERPRFEDDGYGVYYEAKSYQEIQKYRGYSTVLLNRTCGVSGSKTEISQTAFEKIEILMFNYGTAREDFDRQVREVVKGL